MLAFKTSPSFQRRMSKVHQNGHGHGQWMCVWFCLYYPGWLHTHIFGTWKYNLHLRMRKISWHNTVIYCSSQKSSYGKLFRPKRWQRWHVATGADEKTLKGSIGVIYPRVWVLIRYLKAAQWFIKLRENFTTLESYHGNSHFVPCLDNCEVNCRITLFTLQNNLSGSWGRLKCFFLLQPFASQPQTRGLIEMNEEAAFWMLCWCWSKHSQRIRLHSNKLFPPSMALILISI